MLYYIENAAKKCLIPTENTEKRKKTIHYVSSTHNIDTVLEKKYFPDIEFVRNGNNKYYRDKCWQKKNQH